ncbi:MAG: 50S ribosomal protein L13 [Acidobacteriota bacterium]
MNINAHKKTFALKPADIQRKWIVVDASKAPLGRVATLIARRLIGKYQPQFTSHVDSGDHVVVINAAHINVTGAKMKDKTYYSYSGFPGGLKSTSLKQQLETHPERVIEHAVKGMLPKNKLASDRMNRLKVYPEAEHRHAAQKPEEIGVIR